ncbi:hypothetical protein D3C81_1258500 [compost metagenome]
MQGDFLDLQWHEPFVQCGDIVIGRQAVKHRTVAFGDLRLIAQGADVIPLAHAHRTPRFFQRNGDAEFGKGFDENLRGGEGAEIDDGAGPVQDHGLQLGRLLVVHGVSPFFVVGRPSLLSPGSRPMDCSRVRRNQVAGVGLESNSSAIIGRFRRMPRQHRW